MSKAIKGITIELGAETSGLDKALAGVNKTSRDIQKELREVDKLLKFNPKNVELLTQKKKLLGDQISSTKDKLDKLKEAEKQVQEQFARGDISEEQYRAFQREIVETESKLKHYETQLKNVGDTKKSFNDKLAEASVKMKDFGEKVGNAGKTLSKNVTAPIVAGGAALVGLATKAGAAADRILDLRDITGMSTDAIQEWQHVATVAGVDTEAMTNAVEGLVKKIPQLEAEGGKATEAMNRLGLSYENLKTMSPEDQMDTMIKMLAGMEDPLERNAVGAQLFGGAWKDLAPILGMGAEAIEATKQEAHDLGTVLSEDSLNDANAFRIEMDKLKRMLEGVAHQIGADLAPVLRDTLGPIIKDTIIPGIQDFAEKVKVVADAFANLSPETQVFILKALGIAAAMGPVLIVVSQIILAMSTLAGALAKVGLTKVKLAAAAKLVGGAIGAISAPVLIAIAAIAAIIAIGVALYKNWDVVQEKAEALGTFLGETWSNMKADAAAAWSEFSTNISNTAEKIKADVSNNFESVRSTVSEKWEGVKSKTSETWAAVQAKVSEHGGGIKGVLGTSMEGYKTIMSVGWNFINTNTDGSLSKLTSTVRGKFDSVKTNISSAMESARKIVSDKINDIKSFFANLRLKFPKIEMPKLPKFELTGKFSLNPPSVPKLNVKWNAEGAIFTKPYIFGNQGVGEAGPEAILPISKLAGMMADTLRQMGMGSSDSGRAVLDHTGTITVRGVSDRGEAMDVAEIAVEAVLDKMRREGRVY